MSGNTSETSGQVTENSGETSHSLNLKEHRESLFADLKLIRSISMGKFKMQKASNRNRQSWGRLAVSSVEAEAKMLESVQLEALEERLTALEQKKPEED
jgi:hypothetical protein